MGTPIKTIVRIDNELERFDKRIKTLTEERIKLEAFNISHIKDLRTKIKRLNHRIDKLELLINRLDKRTKNLRCSSGKTGPP